MKMCLRVVMIWMFGYWKEDARNQSNWKPEKPREIERKVLISYYLLIIEC
jgi:hypothetical protein